MKLKLRILEAIISACVLAIIILLYPFIKSDIEYRRDMKKRWEHIEKCGMSPITRGHKIDTTLIDTNGINNH